MDPFAVHITAMSNASDETFIHIGTGAPEAPPISFIPRDAYQDAVKLAEDFKESDPRLDIWRRYPDISEDEDDYTDSWACSEVSGEFAEFAREQGWEARTVLVDAEAAFADQHVWVELRRGRQTVAVDWTARQYHNLLEISRDPVVMNAPWPLLWFPEQQPGQHPLMGRFTESEAAA